nr:C-type lectin domain family 4 member F isoform X1 [Manis javanica]
MSTSLPIPDALGQHLRGPGREQKEAEMNCETVHFRTNSQSVSLHPSGLDSEAVAPAILKMPRLVRATVALMAITLISSLVALCVVVLQNSRPALEAYSSFQEFQDMVLGDNTTEQLPVDPNNSYHLCRVAELQKAIQTFKGFVKNSSTWSVEIQMLTGRVDTVNSQIRMLGAHLENTSADIQMVKGIVKDASTLGFQNQMLKSSLEGPSAEIQKLKGDLEKANSLNSQAQTFFKSSLGNTSDELLIVSTGLENANAEIQMLKAGLDMANAQAQLVNRSLKNAHVQIHALRGDLDTINDLRAQNQILRSSVEGANAEIQRLKGSLQNANAFNSHIQTFIREGLDNTSAEIRSLRGHLERASNETHLLERNLETLTAQTQIANGHLEQTDAQIQAFKAELESASTLNSKMQVLNGKLKNASKEIQTLKQGMKDAAALNSKTQMLESNLQTANAEIQRLKGESENTRTLTTKMQEQQSSLQTLQEAFASQEQLHRTQNQLLQLILQGWKVYSKSLYYFSRVKKSWHEAEQFCVFQGAHLASVTSEEEQAFLTETTGTSYHWIGLTDRGTEGSWRWVDGTPFSNAQIRAFWDRNQPDNWQHKNGQTEDCVHVQQKWNDMACDTPYHWVCKKPIDQGVA